MRILVHGQALWGKSAYSHQIRMLLDVLQSAGHECAQACTFGFGGRKIQLGALTLYPHLNENAGQDVIQAHATDFHADLVLSLGDVFMFDPDIWRPFNWASWVTVDSTPLWPGIRNALTGAKHIIAYSKYGQGVLQDSGFEAQYMPLAYDPAEYYPVPMNEARGRMGLPGDRFIVGIVQANRQRDNRKNWFDQLIAFAEFHKRHPDAFLYLHTCMSAYRNGFDLNTLCAELGMQRGRDYDAVDEYIETALGANDDQMRDTYNSMDVLLQATKSEGFGVPALEASACRVPVVFTNFAALPEAVHYGYAVEHELEWQPAGSWYARPITATIVDALERAYNVAQYDLNKGEPTAYRIDVLGDTWLQVVASLVKQPEAVLA